MGKSISIEGEALSDRKEFGELLVEEYSAGARIKRASAQLGICWMLALASVLVPVLHFVLVPGFFLLGLLLAAMASRHKEAIAGGHIRCPHCSAEVSFKPSPLSWPHREVCGSCATWVRIRPKT